MAINALFIITDPKLPKDVAAAILKKLGPEGLRILAKVDKRSQEVILELLPLVFQKIRTMDIPSMQNWLMNSIHTRNDLIKFMEFAGKRGYGMFISSDKVRWLSILPNDNRAPIITIIADAEALPPSQDAEDSFSGYEGKYKYAGKGIMLRKGLLATLDRVYREQPCCIL